MKSHIDPNTQQRWIPPRKRITSPIPRQTQKPLSDYQRLKRDWKKNRWIRGLQRKIWKRIGVNLEGGKLEIPDGKLLSDETIFEELFPANMVSFYFLF